nr:hypothetical protein GCM10020093_001690 [Planobispora longispora]
MTSPPATTTPDSDRQTPIRDGIQPPLIQKGHELQSFGTVRQLPIGLAHDARVYGCRRLNRLLADAQMLYGLYKKHHWLLRGATFYQLHLLLDKHAGEQLVIVDALAERVQSLGGVAVGDPGMPPRSLRCRARPTESRKCPPCSRACCRRTSRS